MEMEASPAAPVVATSKLWNILRIVVFMLKKGIAKSKIKIDLNLLVKRGKMAAGKAIACSIMLHQHYAAFTCRSNDSHLSFISPNEYEFSCSNSPALPFRAIKTNNNSKRKHHKPYKYDDVSAFNAFRKVLVDNPEVANSPLATLPGFGNSPIGRQLRITDSPFPDDGGDAHVDKAAEEFINKFYKDLNLQKRMAASDSPYSNFWDR